MNLVLLLCRSWFLLEGASANTMTPKTLNFRPREWNHFCFAFDKNSASARVVVDGRETSIDGRSYEGLRSVRLPSDLLEK